MESKSIFSGKKARTWLVKRGGGGVSWFNLIKYWLLSFQHVCHGQKVSIPLKIEHRSFFLSFFIFEGPA